MYIFTNALKNITRIKGRSILMFILILAISTSACTALVIKNSADESKASALENMSITAQISFNRESMMQGASGDKESMKEIMSQMQNSLSLEEHLVYSKAESVDDFYYTGNIGLSTTDDGIEVYSSDYSSGMNSMAQGGRPMGMTLGKVNSDFQVTGYSSHDAMSSFIDGTLEISSGSMFDENDSSLNCIISDEISYLNELAVGDEIALVNPSNEDEKVAFTIIGTFSCESTDAYANDIYTSYDNLELICDNSKDLGATYIDERSGEEVSAAFKLMQNATYVFSDIESYDNFATEVEALGLDIETYSISSTDLSKFEESLVPLESTSTFIMVFLIVVLLIGAIILVVFNMFTIRERKYEIGVLAAIGMAKKKVAVQFVSEVLMITFVAVLSGAFVGTLVSEPVANTLLSSQIESVEAQSENVNTNFGGNFQGKPNFRPNQSSTLVEGGMDYVDIIETNSSAIVLVQLLAIGMLLALVSSSAALLSILRYEPLKILSDRT